MEALTNIHSINVLDSITVDMKTHEIKSLQKNMLSVNAYIAPLIYPPYINKLSEKLAFYL